MSFFPFQLLKSLIDSLHFHESSELKLLQVSAQQVLLSASIGSSVTIHFYLVTSLHGGEGGGELVGFRRVLPTSCDGLPLGEEIQGTFAVEVQVATDAAFVSGEGKHGQRHWNRDVNSDLASLYFMLEFPRS